MEDLGLKTLWELNTKWAVDDIRSVDRLVKLPNYENYNVTIESGFGSSCSAGNLDLNANVQGIAWNANC